MDIQDIKRRMDKAFEAFQNELKGLRTGRASPSLLDPVTVEAYGNRLPLNQVGNIGAPEARLLTVQVWDSGLTKSVEKAIRDAGLGLNPMAEGTLIRVPLPELSEERRKEMVKVAHKYAEQQRVAVRNVRRDGMDGVKKAEKEKTISENEARGKEKEIQKFTDDTVKKIDEALAAKEKEILQV